AGCWWCFVRGSDKMECGLNGERWSSAGNVEQAGEKRRVRCIGGPSANADVAFCRRMVLLAGARAISPDSSTAIVISEFFRSNISVESRGYCLSCELPIDHCAWDSQGGLQVCICCLMRRLSGLTVSPKVPSSCELIIAAAAF